MQRSTLLKKSDSIAEQQRLETLAHDILRQAQQQGATQAEVALNSTVGFSVNVRLGEVDTLEYHQDKGVSITVYQGKQCGSASSTDLTPQAITETVSAACHIARLAQADPYTGLPDVEHLAKSYLDLDLYHPWAIEPEQAIELARQCEAQARAVDTRIINSDGVSLGTYRGVQVYANSLGFCGGYASSRHSLNCVLVAQAGEEMQRDGYYTVARDAHDLDAVDYVARESGQRTVKRLGSRRLKTCRVPVIFHAEIATSLISHFLAAISGGNLYRKSSFLIDHLGKPVFASKVQIDERPHLPKALGSAPFDSEGVATGDRTLVTEGILQGYLLSTYSARKLGMQTTGNCGGAHNICIKTDDYSFDALLKKMDTGLLVTEVMGQGINLVTGDYSRGAVGFWVEKGEIQFPVEEITIAGNLRDLFKQIIAVANDIDHNSSIYTGSILIENMMVAGE